MESDEQRAKMDLMLRIQQHIDAIDVPVSWLARGPGHSCKLEHNALPLAANRIYLWALRPDGTVLCMDHEAFAQPVETEHDRVTIFAVLMQGVRRYPELQALVPPRPLDARPCSICNTTGESDAGESCLGCSGLGWHRHM